MTTMQTARTGTDLERFPAHGARMKSERFHSATQLAFDGIPPDVRARGRETFGALLRNLPADFPFELGCKGFVRGMAELRHYHPACELSPWRPDLLLERDEGFHLTYFVDYGDAEFFVGFFEALVEFFGERTFMTVRALDHEVILQVRFER